MFIRFIIDMILTNYEFNQIYIINLLIGFILGPNRNSGSGSLWYRVQWKLGWYQFRSGTSRFGRYQTGTANFFHVVFRFCFELPASRAHCPSSSLTVSRATLLPPVPTLHHVLSSSSLAVSRAPLQFTDCITCYPRVHTMYHAPPPPPLRHLERNIIFIFTVCFFYRYTLL